MLVIKTAENDKTTMSRNKFASHNYHTSRRTFDNIIKSRTQILAISNQETVRVIVTFFSFLRWGHAKTAFRFLVQHMLVLSKFVRADRSEVYRVAWASQVICFFVFRRWQAVAVS